MKVIKPTSLGNTDGSFTRASVAYYWNSARVMTEAAVNEPRFNYNPSNGDFDGVVIESAATNLALYSEQFDNAAWTKTRTTVSANATNAPTGTPLADKLVEDSTAANSHYLFQLVSSTVNTNTYHLSVFVKAGERSKINLYAVEDVAFNRSVECTFNISSGVAEGVVTTSGATGSASIQSVGNSWYRCSLTITLGGLQTAIQLRLQLVDSTGAISYNGDGTSGLYIWGAQFETGTAPSSYITTTSSSATRSPDVFTGSGLMYTSLTDSTPAWDSGTTYAGGDKVRHAYFLWESLQGTNLNKQPDLNPTWWIKLGPDNMHAMFDEQVSTVSTGTTKMTFVVKPGSIDSVALINMVGITAKITSYDQVSQTVVARRVIGLSGLDVFDWYQYFFYDPLLVRTQAIITDLPVYPNALITVEIEALPSETVSLACAVFGLVESIGGTQYGATSGIVDYSIKDTDEFGTATFIRRAFSKRLSTRDYVDNLSLNRVQRYLYNIRATPVVWIANDDPRLEEALVVYGFYKEFSVEIPYPSFSLCSLEIEGLT